MHTRKHNSTAEPAQVQTIRVGNAAGFWGDNLDAPRRMVETAPPDYLTLEYLAELTLSILAHLRSRDPQAGYVTDFPAILPELIPALRDSGLRIITNAGGMNPEACARHVAGIAAGQGLADLGIAAVSGDDLLPRLDDLLATGETFAHFDTGEPLGDRRPRVACANAYLGAAGIVDALRQGARIVITGRVADASLTVAPAVFEFGWKWDDRTHLAAATVAGHLIECGAQVTGGMYSDWAPDADLRNLGYPIAELSADGSVVITKTPGSGGSVSVGTVSEQLVYEIGDPQHYLTPDVDADFSQVRLVHEDADRVSVHGARGNPAPDRYKVSLAFQDGWMSSGTLVISGRDAEQKARESARLIEHRLDQAGCRPARLGFEYLGSGDTVPGVWPRDAAPWEIVLRVTAHDPQRPTIDRVFRELAPLVTSGPPGVTGYTGARPHPHPVLSYWPTTIDRARVVPQTIVRTAGEWLA